MLELNIQANNDTLNLTDRLAIKAEVDELSELMLGLANSKDKDGVALFGGTKGSVDPFQKQKKIVLSILVILGKCSWLFPIQKILQRGYLGSRLL